MDAKSDKIEVANPDLFEPVGGARPEPEEIPARRVLEVDTNANAVDGTFLGKFQSAVTYEETAGGMAQLAGKTCSGCLHWNQELWGNVYRQKFHDKDFNRELNKIRRRLPEGEEEIQLRSMGICMAFSYSAFKDELLTHPGACCPTQKNDAKYAEFMVCEPCKLEFPAPKLSDSMPCEKCRAVLGPKQRVRKMIELPTTLPLAYKPRSAGVSELDAAVYDNVMRLATRKR